MDEDWLKEIASLKKIRTNRVGFIKSSKLINISSKNQPIAFTDEYSILKPISIRLMPKKFHPQKKLDLHGFTRAEALPVFLEFIKRNYYNSIRELLLITGKSNGQNGVGIIRTSVNHWINSAEVRFMIGNFAEAPLHFGGKGAYLIYLKKYNI